MEESEDNMSSEDIKPDISLLCKPKPKKRSLVERELETSLTARITSPITNSEASSTSKYGRARKRRIYPDIIDVEKFVPKCGKSPTFEKSPVKISSPVYRMHASNSPVKPESSKVTPHVVATKAKNLHNQIENIYHENISLSRFGSEEKKITPNKTPKVYVRKDLVQTREDGEESIPLIKNLFSPSNSGGKSNLHLNNILERSSEKYGTSQSKMQNGYASVVKTLDFDCKKKKKENKDGKAISKSELFEMEAKCEYQVGDLAWSRMGTYPFWPCIVTREPMSEMFVKKKLFGRVERDIIHVTFFGDNGRRGWIVDSMLRKFQGQLEFEATRERFTPADKKKDPRLYAAFFISEKKQPQWNISVEEAEALFREPKRLRIDILNEMLMKNRSMKTTPKHNRSSKITRTASDVSLSESLYDTLFSEDDKDDSDTRNRSRKSLDVSEVVTACLDNMAAKTGNIKIQRQSHMDIWLQKAKSKTPEKSHARLQIISQKVVQIEPKHSSSKKKRKSPKLGLSLSQKPYSFRRAANESQNVLSTINDFNTNSEFAPSLNSTLNNIENDSCEDITSNEELKSGSVVIPKVENLSDSANEADIDSVPTGASSTSTSENIDSKGEVPSGIFSEDEQAFSECVEATSQSSVKSNAPSTETEHHSELKVNTDTNSINSNNLYTLPIEENINNEINAVNDLPMNYPLHKQEKSDESSQFPSNNVLNGDINNHDMTEMSSKDSSTFTDPETSQNVVSDNQEINKNNALNEVSKHICTNLKFKKYLELRQDDLMDQHPELNQDEIEEYLHKTWMYEENVISCDITKEDCNKSDSVKLSKKSRNRSKKKPTPRSRRMKNNVPVESNEYSELQVSLDGTKDNLDLSDKQINNYSDTPNEIENIMDTDKDNLIDAVKETDTTHHVTDLDKMNESNEHSEEQLSLDNTTDNFDLSDKQINDCNETPNEIKNVHTDKETLIDAEKKTDGTHHVTDLDKMYESNEHSEKLLSLDSTEDKLCLSDKQINNYNDTTNDIENILNTDNDTITDAQKESYGTHVTDSDKISEFNESSKKQVSLDSTNDSLDVLDKQINNCNDTPNEIENILNTNNDTLEDAQKDTDSLHVNVLEKINSLPDKETDEKISYESDIKENISDNRLLNKASDKLFLTASESDKQTLHESMDISVTVTKSFNTEEQKAMDISYPGNEINEHKDEKDGLIMPQDKNEEIITNSEPSITNDIFSSNNQPVKVGVSEQTEVEIISNKVKDDKEFQTTGNYYNSSSLPEDILEDDSSCESIDISYAISPLSVKGDDADESNIDDLNSIQENSKSIETPINDIEKSTTFNGVLHDAEKAANREANEVRNDKYEINEAGPKTNTVTNETKQTSQDQLKTEMHEEKAADKEHAEVKMNGIHLSKFIADFEGDNISVHSEDSEPLSVTKSKLKLREKGRVNKYADPEFVKYLEMRQDDLADEHPELSQEEIVEYLYKTWQYEEDTKSDIKKTDDLAQSNLVKGLGEAKVATKTRKPRETKKKKDKNDINENSDAETESVKSEGIKRWLRPKKYTSKLYADFDSSRDTSPAITDETTDTFSLDSEECRTNNSTPSDEITKPVRHNKTNSKLSLKSHPLPIKSSCNEVDKVQTELQNGDIDTNSKKSSMSEKISDQNGSKETEVIEKIKEEFDPETASIKSEDSEASVSKRKIKSKSDKKMDDPEFVKYLELRQDALIDENPQLTREEIVGYLYKTWLYAESIKTDIQKSDETEPSNLIKGLNQNNVMPKRVRKKIKVENDFDYDPIQTKPKRKTIQPCYNEDEPDFEDEIAIFEILKNSPTVELDKIDLKQTSKEMNEQKQTETSEEQPVIEMGDEIDEVELYFEALTKPKPNVFKGLIREKVCEICEKVGNLMKCKGCNGMFHIDCVKNETETVDTKCSVTSRGRKKKKKKPGRKPKNLEDSGSMSDEKSQDVSAENMSVDEILEPELRTVDAENFEAQLSAKMKELLESTDKEVHYDSYSSDDGIDWDNSVAGKCEIVDVVLKPKSQGITDFKCNNCQMYDIPICFVCKMAVSKTGIEYRQRCQVAHCHKYYHLECLDHWPQTQFTSSESRNKKTNEVFESHMCPRHVCHTCVSDDPRGCKTRFCGDKLARCTRCPATYHSFTKCLPAGTQILTASHIICPRHYEHRPGKVPCHVNTGWCFICALGGTLICCEYCPTSFHAECLNISPPEGNYMCEDCETGRLPLYGEMVWVKLGHYRWWPGLILHPSEIPDNIMAVKHSPGEFVVRFFGQYDYYWVNRGRVFPFQEGDSGKISSQKSKIDAAFTMAMEHAQRACQILKNHQENSEEALDIASSLLPPHYVKLKVNKPFGSLVNKRVEIEESSLTQCECDPNDPDPCGPYTQCLNRMLLTECGPICRAGERCNNRAFEKRLYPKLVPYRTPHRGWGLKTLEEIKAGQFVIEYVGELIDEEEFRRRMARKHEIRDENFYFLTLDKERMIDAGPKGNLARNWLMEFKRRMARKHEIRDENFYFLTLDKERMIDAGQKGNLARFMNHCCEPNCETQKWTVLGDVRVGLFAIRDIPPNSEVTFNYLLECAGIDKKKCMCGAKRCAGYIGAKPKQDESQPKKSKVPAKRTYKKRKNTEESPSTKTKPKRPVGRPAKPKEMTEIEKDLLIIKNATNGLSSDSECNSRLSSLEGDKNSKALKRKRVSFSSEDVVFNTPTSVKKLKLDDEKSSEVD